MKKIILIIALYAVTTFGQFGSNNPMFVDYGDSIKPSNQNAQFIFPTALIYNLDTANIVPDNITLEISGNSFGFTSEFKAFRDSSNYAVPAKYNLQGMVLGGMPIKYNNTLNQGIVNSDYNTIDNSTCAFILGGGGSSTFPNHIGKDGGIPNGADLTPTDWVADTAYVPGSAIVSLICGGYDNINNQIAGIIVGGGHNFIKYNVDGHSIIGGGSYNVISGGRSGIFSGTGNTITGSGNSYSFIGGGGRNNIIGGYSSIPGGRNVNVTGNYSFGYGYNLNVTASGSVGFKDGTTDTFLVNRANSFALSFSGGVGIGTGNPQDNLHIKANETGAGVSQLRLDNGGTFSNEVGMEFYTSASNSTLSTRAGRICASFDGPSYSNAGIIIQTMASSNTLVNTLGLKNNIVTLYGNISVHDSLINRIEKSSLADDATITLATGVSGWGEAMIGNNQEWASFRFSADGTVTLISNTTNAVNTNTDAKFCIYDGGAGVIIKNALGATLTCAINIHYYAP